MDSKIFFKILKITKNLSSPSFLSQRPQTLKKCPNYTLKDFKFCNFKNIEKQKFQIKKNKKIGGFFTEISFF